MEEADKLCSHIALLNEGSIVEYGEPKEICRKYNHQNKLYIRLYDGKSVELINNRAAAGGYRGAVLAVFMTIMSVGILVSMLAGAAIGTLSRNQMTATSLMMPVMMIFSFLPMLAMFNENIRKAARIAYSRQISILIGQVENVRVSFENIFVICMNMLIALICFRYAYKKCGLAQPHKNPGEERTA